MSQFLIILNQNSELESCLIIWSNIFIFQAMDKVTAFSKILQKSHAFRSSLIRILWILSQLTKVDDNHNSIVFSLIKLLRTEISLQDKVSLLWRISLFWTLTNTRWDHPILSETRGQGRFPKQSTKTQVSVYVE